MCPTISIDDQVYGWLQSQAIPFVDTPNSVLRRIASLDDSAVSDQIRGEPIAPKAIRQNAGNDGRRSRLAKGNELIGQWKIPARQARFRRDGTWFAPLTRFPAALCDCKGYLVFETPNELNQCAGITVHPSGQITAQSGISAIRGYVKVDNPIRDPYSANSIKL